MKKEGNSIWINGLAGAISGSIEATAVWPSELIKTKLQLQLKSSSNNSINNVKYKGIVDCFRVTVRETGFFSLYRGLAPIILLSLPKASSRFAGYEYFARKFKDPITNKTSSFGNFIAGMTAGIIEGVLVVTPGETIKTKLISSNQGLISGVKSIVKEEGFAGLYKGMTATVLKQASNHGIRFFAFNEIKTIMLSSSEKKNLSPQEALVAGMLAGCLSVMGNNPIDVLKSRMQDRPPSTELGGPYKNTLDCARRLIKADGLSGFYKGTVARLTRVVPGQGIIFASYETILAYLQKNLS